MNYLELLSKDEKRRLCEIITGEEFKNLFVKNENAFTHIRSGFRAKSLDEQAALSIAIGNTDKTFIAAWINKWVEITLSEMEEKILRLEKRSLDSETSLAITVLDSVFCNDLGLFLKLSKTNVNAEFQLKICNKIDSIRNDRRKELEESERVKEIEKEKKELLERVELAEQDVRIVHDKCEEQLREKEKEKDRLKESLRIAEERIERLKLKYSDFAIDDISLRKTFDDTKSSLNQSKESYEFISLCKVFAESVRLRLIRYADLDDDGCFHEFILDKEKAFRFENRDRLYADDGPTEVNRFGIWRWSAKPRENDPFKDHVESKFVKDRPAVEIVINEGITNLQELVLELKKGKKLHRHSNKLLFSYLASENNYTGLLCDDKDLKFVDGTISFDDECREVPVYNFSKNDILYLENGFLFYNKEFLGIPDSVQQIKSPSETVKEIVQSSFSWNSCKAMGATRSQYKAFKEFLEGMPTSNITKEIELKCHCSETEANILISDYMDQAWKYIDGESLESEIIESAINNNEELMERVKTLVKQDWETENKELLREARNELYSIEDKVKTEKEQYKKLQESLADSQSEKNRLIEAIAEKEKLADQVEKNINEKIQNAKNNAADFIAKMAFVNGNNPTHMSEELSPLSKHYSVIEASDADDLEQNHTWEEVIDTVTMELQQAGVMDNYLSGLAAYLCAAYIEKQPLLLIGPNAIDIAEAFCAAVVRSKRGVLNCDGEYDNRVPSIIGQQNENVVIINNLLTSQWVNRLPEIVANKDVFYIAIHPYAEDVQVEPKSLFEFLTPVFTECLVDKRATGDYLGGYFSQDFKSITVPDNNQKIRILSRFSLSPITGRNINQLIAVSKTIFPDFTQDDEFLLAIFPIAYATLKVNTLKKAIDDSSSGVSVSSYIKKHLEYILGDPE